MLFQNKHKNEHFIKYQRNEWTIEHGNREFAPRLNGRPWTDSLLIKLQKKGAYQLNTGGDLEVSEHEVEAGLVEALEGRPQTGDGHHGRAFGAEDVLGGGQGAEGLRMFPHRVWTKAWSIEVLC